MQILISSLFLYSIYLSGERFKSSFLRFKEKSLKFTEVLISISLGVVLLQYFLSLLSIFNKPFLYKIATLVFLLSGLIVNKKEIIKNYNFIINKLIKNRINNKKFNFKFSLQNLLEKIILVIYFLLSFIPISSGDSLDYHLGVPQQYLQSSQFDPTWYHSLLAMNGEKLIASFISINALPLIQLIQFLGLVNIYFLLKNVIEIIKIDKFNNRYIYNILKILPLAIASSPIFIFLTLTAKPQLFPISLLIITNFLLVRFFKEKLKINIKDLFIIFSIIFTATTSKYSLLIAGFINMLIFIFVYCSDLTFNKKGFYSFKTINLFKSLITVIFSFLIIYVPFALHRIYFYDSSILNSFFSPLNTNFDSYNFLNMIRNYRENNLPFPFFLLVPTSFSNLTSILGVFPIYIVLIFLLVKNKLYVSVSLIVFLIISVLAPPSTRFFLAPLLILLFTTLLQLLRQDDLSDNFTQRLLKIFIKPLNYILNLQSICIITILCIFYFSYLNSVINKTYSFEEKYINGYTLHQYLNDNFNKDDFIFLGSRTRAISNLNFASLEPLEYPGKDSFKNFVQLKERNNLDNKSEIIVVSDHASKLGKKLNQCLPNSFSKNLYLKSTTRNPLSELRRTVKWDIRKVRFENLLSCNEIN